MLTEQARKGSRCPARHAAHTTAHTAGLSSPWRLREEGTPEGKGRNTIDSTQAAACFINVLYGPSRDPRPLSRSQTFTECRPHARHPSRNQGPSSRNTGWTLRPQNLHSNGRGKQLQKG